MNRLTRTMIVALLATALLAYGLPPVWGQDAGATAAEERDYGQRDAGSKGLEDFTGGLHHVVFIVVVVAAVAACVWLVIWPDYHCYCPEHRLYHHYHPPEAPKPEPKL